MSDSDRADDEHEPDQAKEAQAGEEQTDHGTDAPLNGGGHTESGSYTSTSEDGVSYDGAFTDSEIPADGVKPGETEVDKAGFEGNYIDSDGVD